MLAAEREAEEAVISFGFDDEDDEFADLFSFATAASQTQPISADLNYTEALSSPMPLSINASGHNGANDDDQYEEVLSVQSVDSFLELLEQQKDPVTVLDAPSIAKESIKKEIQAKSKSLDDSERGDIIITDSADHDTTQEILDWLEKDDEEVTQQAEGKTPAILPPQPLASEDISLTLDNDDTTTSSPIHFETLEEAVKSAESNLSQIRHLLEKESFRVSPAARPHLWCRIVCGKSLEHTLKSSVADSFQQWEQRQEQSEIGGTSKGLKANEQEREARSDRPLGSQERVNEQIEVESNDEKNVQRIENPITDQGEGNEEENDKDTESKSNRTYSSPENNTKIATSDSSKAKKKLHPVSMNFPEAQQKWIDQQSASLANRIAEVLDEDVGESQQALKSLLMNHYHSTYLIKVEDGTMEEHSDATEYHDPLLPAVACAILSTGVPKAVAAVMLSQIVPNFMPILTLTMSERQQASMTLQRHLYLLTCYHLPLLALHLDKYMPNWYQWPSKGGLVPPSYLISHLAGECPQHEKTNTNGEIHVEGQDRGQDRIICTFSSGFFMDPDFLLCLWDVVLTSSNNSLRYFLILALLETHANQLILLTGKELMDRLVEVISLKQIDASIDGIDTGIQGEMTPEKIRDLVKRWTDKAQLLWERTPLSISRRLKRLEDHAVTETLTKRQKEARERKQRRLETEARAHQEAIEAEHERKAEEARLRLTRARLVAFYRQYNPGKETNIDTIMKTYEGRYEVLDAKLRKKYGVGFNPAVKPKNLNRNKPKARPIPTKAKEENTEKLFAEQRKKNQVVAKVAPSEVLPKLCWSKEANQVKLFKLNRGNKLEEAVEGRLPLKFFLIDSRPIETAQEQGRFPTSVSLTPGDLLDPEKLRVLDETFEAFRGAVHIVIMGEGFASLPVLYGHKFTNGLAECIREDDFRNNSCAIFFLKRGFPFVSVLDGGFAGAHSFLCREGPKHLLRVQDVLADYNPDVSMFGQFERVHNETGREKAQRTLQNIFDSSLVAITKNTRRLETLASELGSAGDERPQKKPQPGNMVTRFFAGPSMDETWKPRDRNVAQSSTESQGPGFRNPFAILNTQGSNESPKKLKHQDLGQSLDGESVNGLVPDSTHEREQCDSHTDPGLTKTSLSTKEEDPKAPLEKNQTTPHKATSTTMVTKSSDTEEALVNPSLEGIRNKVQEEKLEDTGTIAMPEVKPNDVKVSSKTAKTKTSTKVTEEKKTNLIVDRRKPPEPQKANPFSEPQKANPFSGFGAAFNNSLKAASKVAAGEGGQNLGSKGRPINPFARFGSMAQQGRGLGNSQHGGQTLSKSQHGNNKAENNVPSINLAGFNQFRKNTFARMRNAGDLQQGTAAANNSGSSSGGKARS